MAKRMLIDAVHPEETRVVIADDKQIYDFDFVSTAKKQLKGNIYLAKITRVEPSLQAAFVEYGGNKQGFLPFSEIHPDYYQIPMSDRKRLMEEAEDEAEEDEKSEAPASEAPEENAAPEPEAIEAAPEGADEKQDQPAFLTEGAIDVSASEYVEEPETAEAVPETAEQPSYNNEEAPTEASTETPQDGASEASANSEVETLDSEEDATSSRPKKNFTKRYRIQEVIRRGQIVLVQVIKEERGNKGVSLTTYLSLAGRYCVLMPNSPKDGGISRKIASPEDRKRLKAISTEMRLAKGMSVIIRTAGMDRTRAEIKRDYDYLVKVWNMIREDTLKSNAPALIYEESDIIKRAIRDQYTSEIGDVIVEGEAGFNAARDFMKLLLPSHTPKVKQYQEQTPLFYAYNIEDQLLSMHDPAVKLRSGGYIVINPTEALISIDVNSGRFTGERNIEETATKTNLEAAVEVARQLRLRDLAGLIVIDFIDMLESRNRRAVEKALKDALKLDRAKIQLGRISPFGLLEMSRQRLRPSISETNMVQCPHCIGRGYIRSGESMSIQMIRAIEKEASTGTWSGLRLLAPQAVALHLLNTRRDALRAIEQRYSVTIQVLVDPTLATSEFNLEKMRRSPSERTHNEQRRRQAESQRAALAAAGAEMAESIENETEEDLSEPMFPSEETPRSANENRRERGDRGERGERGGRRRGRRGGRNRNKQRFQDGQATEQPQEADGNVQEMEGAPEGQSHEAPGEDTQGGDNRSSRRGRRGGRGRRRWRDQDGGQRDNTRQGQPQGGSREDAPVEEPADGKTLPAFATEERPQPPPRPEVRPEPIAAIVNLSPPAPREPRSHAKKGWWQKMIELDE